jgi:hypothetical protein
VKKERNLNDQVMTEHMGGQVASVVKALKGKRFKCDPGCGHEIIITDILGWAPHGSGYNDKDGMNWWIYVRCPHCEYDWAVWKIVRQLEK